MSKFGPESLPITTAEFDVPGYSYCIRENSKIQEKKYNQIQTEPNTFSLLQSVAAVSLVGRSPYINDIKKKEKKKRKKIIEYKRSIIPHKFVYRKSLPHGLVSGPESLVVDLLGSIFFS